MALHTLGFIKQLKEKYNVTILISEQNLEVADISDYICVLKGGEIMNQFTTADWSKLTRGEITEMVFGRTA
jgi:ABC-type multidrug transport system ATPase subunit